MKYTSFDASYQALDAGVLMNSVGDTLTSPADLKRALRRIGYRLAATSYAVPSILAYTEAEWDHRKRAKSPFSETVERGAVRVM